MGAYSWYWYSLGCYKGCFILIIKALVLTFYYMSFGLVNLGLITETINPDDTTYYDRKIVYELDVTIPELNNHTLAEVFEDGLKIANFDFSSDFTGWSNVNNFNTISTTDYFSSPKSANQTNELQARYLDIIGNTTDKFYISWYGKKVGSGEGARLWVYNRNGFSNGTSKTIISSSWTKDSFIISKTNGIRLMIGHYTDNVVVNNFYDDIRVYNLSELGISNLTVEQMDTYFSWYQLAKAGTPYTEYLEYVFTPNELSRTDVVILVSSLVIWFFGISFLVSIIDLKRRLF